MTVRYKATMASSGLLLAELQVVAEAMAFGQGRQSLRAAVVDENILVKPTVRARKKVWEKLNDRYALTKLGATGCYWLQEIRSSAHEGLAQLAVLRWASMDLLLRTFWLDLYLPRSQSTSRYGAGDVLQWIEAGELRSDARRYFMQRSVSVQESIAQHFLVLLRTLGAAAGRAKKTFRPCLPTTSAVAFARKLAEADGAVGSAMLDYWALRWWGDTASRADALLAQLHREGGWQ